MIELDNPNGYDNVILSKLPVKLQPNVKLIDISKQFIIELKLIYCGIVIVKKDPEGN
jgi:hypothetical protein